jgi:molybdenum cofactor cytidylyltransferase
MIAAVILASGRSTRMGRPKALLELPGSGLSFVRALATTFRDGGALEVLVVGRPDDERLQTEVASLARFVANPHADEGQLTSVLAALGALDRPGVTGMLVCPVDVPLVRPSTVATLLSRFADTHAPIVRAVHHGRHGHPVLFSRSVFDELRRADRAIGARSVVRAHADRLLNVEVDDPGVLRDVDTPEDYARLTEREDPSRS